MVTYSLKMALYILNNLFSAPADGWVALAGHGS